MGTYWTIVTCRNSENSIEKALLSLKAQTIKPDHVIVVDDGSTDSTPKILRTLQANWPDLYVITNHNEGYDIGRVVKNWNKAIKFSSDMKLKETDYHMIITDDTIFETEYSKKLVTNMDTNPSIAIASGNYDDNNYVRPHGAGRFVRNSFFLKYYGLYPEKMGYESVILYTTRRYNYTYKVINDARFVHTRKLGKNHRFYEFGASMKTLGYHPLFVLGRFCKYFITRKPIGRLGAINMIYYYLSYRPNHDGYNSMHEKEIRDFIRKDQIKRIKDVFRLKLFLLC